MGKGITPKEKEDISMKIAIRSGIALFGLILVVAVGVSTTEAKTNRFATWMGEKIFDGRTGPWLSEARLVDPKAQVEEARAAGKIPGVASGAYHFVFYVAQPRPKTPIILQDGSGTVTVTGPDKKTVTKNLTRMDGHFSADIALNKPGEYRFTVDIEAGGAKGTTTFAHAIK
jgi:hypothetical protein